MSAGPQGPTSASQGVMAAQFFTYKGIPFPCLEYSPETLDYVDRQFQVQDDDIFNITYPKAGRQWRGTQSLGRGELSRKCSRS